MSRYIIWDKKSTIITPSGHVFTPEQWIEQHPVAGLDGVKTVISGGTINGSIFNIYDSMKEYYSAQGCDFSKCSTDQECLDIIEYYEDHWQDNTVTTPTAEERIAAALEAQVMMNMPDTTTTEE